MNSQILQVKKLGLVVFGLSLPGGIYSPQVFAGSGQSSSPLADVLPPIITPRGVHRLQTNSAQLQWTTNEPAVSRVGYGTQSPTQILTPFTGSYITQHVVRLNGLTPGTQYRYQLISRDAAGNQGVSLVMSFKTLGTAPSPTPTPTPTPTPLVVKDAFSGSSVSSNWAPLGPYAVNSQFTITGMTDLAKRIWGATGMYWSANSFSSDQFSEAVISPNMGYAPNPDDSLLLEQVFVRFRSSDKARYGFHFEPEVNGTSQCGKRRTVSGRPEWQLKFDGVPSCRVVLMAYNPNMRGPMPGDTIRIEVQGMTIKGFWKQAGSSQYIEVLRYTDTNPLVNPNPIAAGRPGIVTRERRDPGYDTSVIQYPTPIFDEWSGGEL